MLFHFIYNTTIASSTIRANKVANAAPRTPRVGNPKSPKIRIAFPITNLDANTGKCTMTFEYENLKEGEGQGDPAWKCNYAVFGVAVDVPRSSAVMEALRKVWPKKK